LVERTASATFLARHATVGLDTNVLIYLVEDHPRYGGWCASLLERIERQQHRAVSSTISLLEALVQPYRLQNDRLVEKFYALLSTYPHLSWVPVTIDIADRAAELRARYRLSTPDAVQIATAIGSGATGFIGNDKGIRKISEIECVILDDEI
jgi:predicted nucleic acid-binding protein